MIKIDGSEGEVGGQIVRTAVTLGAVLNKSIQVSNIRRKRDNPGLKAQHVTAVNLTSEICNAEVSGNVAGSTELRFVPNTPPQSGKYEVDVSDAFEGTSAASTSLILQTVLIPLGYASETSRLTIRGGTHVEWSPPFHYVRDVYFPFLRQLGFEATVSINQWGFFPEGRGMLHAVVEGQGVNWEAGGINLLMPGPLQNVSGISAVSNLSHDILERQTETAGRKLKQAGFDATIRTMFPESTGPGTVIFIRGEYENVTVGFTGYGRKGKPAERVATEAVNEFLEHHRSGQSLDPYLSDQCLIPLALSPTSSRFSTSTVTSHLLTNKEVVNQITGKKIDVKKTDSGGIVSVHGSDK